MLGVHRSVKQAIAHLHHRPLPAREHLFYQPADFVKAQGALHLAVHLLGVRPQHVNQRDFISFAVRSDRLLQGNLVLPFLAGAQAQPAERAETG